MGYKLNSNCNCNPKPSSGDETNVCFGAVEIYKSGGSGGVITVDSIAALPNLGDQNIAYIVEKENQVYRWDSATAKYFVVGSDYSEIKLINGGNADATVYGG